MTGDNYPTCRRCGERIRYQPKDNEPTPVVCGRYTCRALEHWTPERWEGQHRQAMARHAAGVPLQPLDREAIRRVGEPAA